jgi:hypothetical protein
MADNLLLKFRDADSEFGVTRNTIQRLAKQLNMTETSVVHIAMARLAKDLLPAYERDEGPLSAQDRQFIAKEGKSHLPRGKVVSRKSLL